MRVINTEHKPIKMWINHIEDWALEQAKNLANLPFIHQRVAIMPDSHQWYGMPIWWVIATEWVVIPNAVWVDIGCGMCAVKTSLTELDTDTLKKIMWKIRELIPVWFNKHQYEQFLDFMPETGIKYKRVHDSLQIVQKEFINARKSLWTLGWGNHFIEIQKWDDWHIRIMIHSWSRNLGKQVADYYNKVAIELNQNWYTQVSKERELAFLPTDSDEWQAYIKEMQYCVDFALANRKLMMNRVIESFNEYIDTEELQFINIAHNYARLENHMWKNVMVHRKWATSAKKWELGIIPWSQWTCSYIVEWLGNAQSFTSCSHWAWRKMWRKQAQKNLNLEEEIKRLDDQWIVHWVRNINDLDEASWAYKDIDEVMENQKDLVKILVKLKPIWVIKG